MIVMQDKDYRFIPFRSEQPLTPFAPQWNYHIGCELISHVDFKKIAKIILKKLLIPW